MQIHTIKQRKLIYTELKQVTSTDPLRCFYFLCVFCAYNYVYPIMGEYTFAQHFN